MIRDRVLVMVAAAAMGAHHSTHGDMQWWTGPQGERDDFYAGSATVTETSLRDVAQAMLPAVGQTLCLNGRTTHRHCQQVRDLSVCSDGACNLVQMGADMTQDGDSGGPWHASNTAYGIHQGDMCDPTCPFVRNVFTRATRFALGMGVAVATS